MMKTTTTAASAWKKIHSTYPTTPTTRKKWPNSEDESCDQNLSRIPRPQTRPNHARKPFHARNLSPSTRMPSRVRI